MLRDQYVIANTQQIFPHLVEVMCCNLFLLASDVVDIPNDIVDAANDTGDTNESGNEEIEFIEN